MATEKFFSKYTAAELENIFDRADGKPFVLYYDKAAQVYRMFPTEEDRDIWVAAWEAGEMTEEIAKLQFTEPFTAPAPYTINVNSLRDNQYILYKSTGNYLTYSFNTVDGKGSIVNESVDVYYTFKTPTGTRTTSEIYNANTNVALNVDDLLSLGTNVITILLRGRSTGATKTVVVTYYVVQLEVSSTFDISRHIEKQSNFDVTYTVIGQSDKTVNFYIDGQLVVTSIVTSLEPSATRTQRFDNSDGKWAGGKHTLQIQASMSAGDQQFVSNLLYYEFIISDMENLPTQTHIMIQQTFPRNTPILVGTSPGLTGEQYVATSIVWAYYSADPTKRHATITWKLTDSSGTSTTLATRTADVVQAEIDKMPDPLVFVPTEYGNYNLQATIDNIVIEGADYTIAVIQNTAGIIETTEGLTLKLSGIGRSNEEPEDTRDSWFDRDHHTTFYNQPWDGVSGWGNNALVLNEGATAIVDHKPFAIEVSPTTNNGCVIELDFETFNVRDTNAKVFSIGGNTGASLVITADKAILKSNYGAETLARFKSDERVKLAFVVYPSTTSDYPLKTFIYSNGVLSAVNSYVMADNFDIGSTEDTSSDLGKIFIGNADGDAGIKVYYLRTYNAKINMYEELNNYIIDSGDSITKLLQQNNIYSPNTRSIDVDKLEGIITTVKITGPLDQLINKGGKNKITAGLEITSPSNPEINFNCDLSQLSNAGQSTLDKPIPSLHVKLDKNGNVCYDRDGNILPKNRWAFRTGNIPEKKFRLQANYMDSSGCHNAAFFRMFNEVAPKVQINNEYVLRMPAEDYALSKYPAAMTRAHGEDPSGNEWKFPYTFHMVPDSIPCVVVWRQEESLPYNFLGQYVIMEEKKSNYSNGMHSIYDTLDDEGNPDPFNFKSSGGNRLWDNADCHQFELLTSTDDLTLFLDDSSWSKTERDKTFELIYPDTDDLTEQQIEAEWRLFYNNFLHKVCETSGNQIAFNNLYGTILDKWQFAAYYCLALRNCCSDSLARNMEMVTYDGTTWLPKWWDVDMECGLYQTGSCNLEPMTTRSTIAPGTENSYALSGRVWLNGVLKSSWLWDGLEGCSEFQEDKKLMDAALYAAGWNYSNMTKAQDDEYIKAWSQSLFNESSISKYLDYNQLVNLQGDRTPHRHWFLKTSYDYFDAVNVCGEYKGKTVNVRTEIPAGTTFSVTPGAASFFGWGTSTSVDVSGIEGIRDIPIIMTVNRNLQLNNPLHLYAANKIEKIDFSNIATYMAADLDVSNTYDSVTGTLLRILNIGVPKSDMNEGLFNLYTDMNRIIGTDIMTRVEELNIQGIYYMLSLDFSKMSSLKKLYAAGSSLANFNPANGSKFSVLELPYTVTSMAMNGCSLTHNNDCVITWYETLLGDVEKKTISGTGEDITIETTIVTGPTEIEQKQLPPDTLTYLNFSGMGSDIGTKIFVSKWISAMRMSNRPNIYNSLQFYCTNVNWDNFSVQDIIDLGKIPASKRNITGYIKCSGTLTTEQMNILIDEFDDKIFTTSGSLIIDCDSSNIIISANGPGTSVNASTGAIEIIQGTNAQFQAVGFPIIGNTASYTWFVKDESSPYYSSGSEAIPNIIFRQNSIHWKTGEVKTTECADLDRTYDIYVEGNSGSTGNIKLVVKSRSYPIDATIAMVNASASTEVIDGTIQIIQPGSYIFDASFTPANTTGRLKEVNGGVWNLQGFDEDIMSRDDNYQGDRNEDNEYRLLVSSLPDEDLDLVLKYTSNWRNNLQLHSNNLPICVCNIVEDILTMSQTSGNPPLYNAILATGILPVSTGSYDSYVIKKVTGTLNFAELLAIRGLEASDLKNMTNGPYDVLKYLRNVTTLNYTDCIGLEEDIDISNYPNYTSLNLTNTYVNAIIGANSPLVSLILGNPTEVEVIDPLYLNMSNFSIVNTDDITSIVISNMSDNKTFAKLAQIISKGASSLEHIEVSQLNIENISWDVLDNIASIIDQLDSTSDLRGILHGVHGYIDSKTLIEERFENLTINISDPYYRFLDLNFLNAIKEDFGDGEGLTMPQILDVTSFGTSIQNNTSIKNLQDLNIFTNLVFPDNELISDSQFYGCSGIERIKFPSVLEIGSNTFANLNNLQILDFSECENLQVIATNAFSNCVFNGNINLSQCEDLTSANLLGLTDPDEITVVGLNNFSVIYI